MGENGNGEKFTFLTEQIKEKSVSKRKILKWALVIGVMGLIFGSVASISYTYGVRHMEEIIYSNSASKVTIDDTESSDEETAGISDDSTDDDSESDESMTVSEDEEKPEEQEDAAGEEQAVTPVINNINNIVEKVDLDITDYENLYKYFYDVAKESEKCIVKVTAVESDKDWFDNTYENETEGTGIVIADNRKELLVLVQSNLLSDAHSTYVSFPDGSSVPAEEKKYDSNLGLSIIAVPLEEINEDALNSISSAKFGSSKDSAVIGKNVMAIGAPLGIDGSIEYGMVTSASSVLQLKDTDVHVITTNIYGSNDATGILVNLRGEIIGIISNECDIDGLENLITAYGISDIKKSIERMSNGQDKACLGIYGSDISEEIRNERSIPEGVYVSEIAMDSPAMDCGIQSGDVITMIGTMEIKCLDDFKKVMDEASPGDETTVTVSRFAKGEYTEMTFDVVLGVLE